MKARLEAHGGRLIIEVDAEDARGIFEQLATAQECLDSDRECGLCNETALRFIVRKKQGFTFHELACVCCCARLAFGQTKEAGLLFPRRRDESGNPLPSRGWAKYVAESKA